MSKKKFEDLSDQGGWVWFPADYSPLKNMPTDMKKRHIQDAAKRDAEQNIPSVDSTEPVGMEAEIWSRTISGCGQIKNRFSDRVNSCFKSIRSKNQLQATLDTVDQKKIIAQEYEAVVPELHRQVENIMGRSGDEVKNDYLSFLEAKRRLVNFREDHDLKREAKYPLSPWSVIGTISILAIIETGLNGFMFRDVADGLVGGFFLALMLSLVNIASGIVVGFLGLRQLFAKGLVAKFAGSAFTIIFGIIGIMLNFFVAHYREVAADFDGFEAVAPMRNLLQNPFGLQEAEAFILLIFGLLIFVYSAYKGFASISDKYPGYRDVDESYLDAEDRSLESIENLREEVSTAFNEYKQKYEDKINHEGELLKGAKGSLRKLLTMREDAMVSIEQCIGEGNSLLDLYRSSNSRRRLGVVIPRFKERLTRENAMESDLESVTEVENLVKDIEKISLKNAKAYKEVVTASYAYGKNANLELSDFLKNLREEAADENQYGRQEFESIDIFEDQDKSN